MKTRLFSILAIFVMILLATSFTASNAFFSDKETTSVTFKASDNWCETDACVTVYPGICKTWFSCFCPPIIVKITLPYDSGHDAWEIVEESVKIQHNGSSVTAYGGFRWVTCFDSCCPPCGSCETLHGCCETLYVFFDRNAVDEMLHDSCGQENVTLFLTGNLESGECFTGSDDVDLMHCSTIDYGIAEPRIQFVPDTIDLNEDGPIPFTIQFTDGIDINDVDTSSFILANDNFIATQPESCRISDINDDGIADMLCKLNRSDIEYFFAGKDGDVVLQLSGIFLNGDTFSGNAIVNIIAANDPEPTPDDGGVACFITSPANGANISIPGPVYINGSAGADADVSEIKVQILDIGDDFYWNGSVWVSTLEWSDAPVATGTSNWSYADLPAWGNGSSYQVLAQATDGTYTNESTSVLFGIGVDPVPLSTPTPTPEATPTPEPTPEITPTPEPTPEATPTPEPTPETTPTPEPTPEATLTPESTPEVTPTPEPTPEATPTPEPTPETTPTPEATPEATPTPEEHPYE